MLVIGLCGGSAAGKGTVAEIFRKRDIPVLDTDALYHRMIRSSSPCTKDLIAAFGEGIQNADGGIDRSALSAIVFAPANQNKLLLLNQITHFHILNECEKWEDNLRQNGALLAVYDAPLLFESGLDKRCDITLGIVADDAWRVQRIVSRDGITVTEAKQRIAAQMSQEELKLRVNYCIENNGTTAMLCEQVELFLNEVKRKFAL